MWLYTRLAWQKHINELSCKYLNLLKVLLCSPWGVHPKENELNMKHEACLYDRYWRNKNNPLLPTTFNDLSTLRIACDNFLKMLSF